MRHPRGIRIQHLWPGLAWILLAPALGQDPAPRKVEQAATDAALAEITNLVRQLSALDFKSREQAASKLKQFTASEIPLLEPFAHSDDPEPTLRLREIIEHLRSHVWLVDVDGTSLSLEDYRLKKQRADKQMKFARDAIMGVMKGGGLPGLLAGIQPPSQAQPEQVLDGFIRETLLLHEAEKRKIMLTEAEKEAAVKNVWPEPDTGGLLSKDMVAAAKRIHKHMSDTLDPEETRQPRIDAMLARKLLAAYMARPFRTEPPDLNNAMQEQKDMTAMIEELKTKATIRKNQEAIDALLTKERASPGKPDAGVAE